MSSDIGLSELINKIKEELAATRKESPVFFVEKVELELQVTVSRSTEVKGQGEAKTDLKINVLSVDILKLGEAKAVAEATGTMERENAHKINITLTPAILNKELMNNLSSETKDVIVEKFKQIILQGNDNDRI